jgi:hypothetical protein
MVEAIGGHHRFLWSQRLIPGLLTMPIGRVREGLVQRRVAHKLRQFIRDHRGDRAIAPQQRRPKM